MRGCFALGASIEALERGRDARLEEMTLQCEPAISYSGLGVSATAEPPFIRWCASRERRVHRPRVGIACWQGDP